MKKMPESKATQCPICKKGKRESDPYCSEKCALAHLLSEGDKDAVVVFCPSLDGSNEIDPLDLAAQAEAWRDEVQDAEPPSIIGVITSVPMPEPVVTMGVCDVCGEDFDPVFGACRNAFHKQEKKVLEETELTILNQTKVCARCKRPLKSPGENGTYAAYCEGCLE